MMRRTAASLRPLLQASGWSLESSCATQLEAASSRACLILDNLHGRSCSCAECSCSTSGSGWQAQQLRSFAKKPATKASKPATTGSASSTEASPYTPQPAPKPDMSTRVTSSLKGLTHEQRQLLQALVPDGAPLRSLRQLGWPLSRQDVLQLQEHYMTQETGQISQVTPFIFDNIFLSAEALAEHVAEAMTDGQQFNELEQMLHLALPESSHIVRGLKIQVKGIISGRAGKASKRVFTYGLTSIMTLDDCVDYAMATATTKNGHLGIKVWIIYHTGAVPHNLVRSRPAPEMSLEQMLAAPRDPVQRSSTAWWPAAASTPRR